MGVGLRTRASAFPEGLSALEAVRTSLARIEALDGSIRAFVRTNPRAEDEARAVDAARRRGPLAGVPLAVKDNLCTRGLETTCASRILEGFRPARDATSVARARAAGAVVIGKTNLDEFGMGSSTENSAFGPTRNPWDTDRVPGGSSGGSAAAVAAAMSPVALGSDTGGSIRQPAALCGVVGLKPTYGRVSRLGLVAFASSLDQVGPIATSVSGCARLLQVLAGPDGRDATSARRPTDDYPAACREGARGLRVGWPSASFEGGVDPAVSRLMARVVDTLRLEGATVEEMALPHARLAIPAYYVIATAEASSNLARFDGVRFGRRARVGNDVDAMYGETRGRGFGAEVRRRVLLGTFVLSAGHREAFYEKAMRARALIARDFSDAFRTGFDVVLMPTTPSPAFRIGERIDDPVAMYLSDVYTVAASLAGLPAISIPAGMTPEGLPVGAQLIAPHFREASLFRAAGALEAAA